MEDVYGPGAGEALWQSARGKPQVIFMAVRFLEQMCSGDPAEETWALDELSAILTDDTKSVVGRVSLAVFVTSLGYGDLRVPRCDHCRARHDAAMARLEEVAYPELFRLHVRMTQEQRDRFDKGIATLVRYERRLADKLADLGVLPELFEECINEMLRDGDATMLFANESVMMDVAWQLSHDERAAIGPMLLKLRESLSFSRDEEKVLASLMRRMEVQIDDPLRFVRSESAPSDGLPDPPDGPPNPWDGYGAERIDITPTESVGVGHWDAIEPAADGFLACWDGKRRFYFGLIHPEEGVFDIWASFSSQARNIYPGSEKDVCLAQMDDVIYVGRTYDREDEETLPGGINADWPAFLAIRKSPQASKGYSESSGLPGRAVSDIAVLNGHVYLSVDEPDVNGRHDPQGNVFYSRNVVLSSTLVRFDPAAESFELLLSHRRVGTGVALEGTNPYAIGRLTADTQRDCLYFNAVSVDREAPTHGTWRYSPADGTAEKIADRPFRFRHDEDHLVVAWPMAINLDSHELVSLRGDQTEEGDEATQFLLANPGREPTDAKPIDAENLGYSQITPLMLDGHYVDARKPSRLDEHRLTLLERDSQRAWAWRGPTSAVGRAQPWRDGILVSVSMDTGLYWIHPAAPAPTDDGEEAEIADANRAYERFDPPPSEPVRLFTKAGRLGVLHRDKGVVVPAIYAFYRGPGQADAFSWGLATVSILDEADPDYIGDQLLIDAEGRPVTRELFAQIMPMSEGLSPAQVQTICPHEHCGVPRHWGDWGYVDLEGDLAIAPAFGAARGFSNGLAAVADSPTGWQVRYDRVTFRGGKWGYIDRTGELVIPMQYAGVSDYHEGLASVSVVGKGCAVIDLDGNVVIPPQYSRVGRFNGGRAWATKSFGTFGTTTTDYILIDSTGREITQPISGTAKEFSDQRAWVKQKDDPYWVAIDPEGKVVINDRIVTAEPFEDGMARVSTNKSLSTTGRPLVGCVDVDGRWVVEPRFADLGAFHDGLAAARLELERRPPIRRFGQWGFVDRQGQWVLPPQFETAEAFHNGMARVIKDGHVLYIDTGGAVVLDVGPLWYETGMIVTIIAPETPASRAGLKVGDIILRIGKMNASHYGQLSDVDYNLARTYTVWRGGETFTFDCPPGKAGFWATSMPNPPSKWSRDIEDPVSPETPEIIRAADDDEASSD
jgi:hypothetical protein